MPPPAHLQSHPNTIDKSSLPSAMYRAPPRPPPTPPNRQSALRYMLGKADSLHGSFFSIGHPADSVDWVFRGVRLSVVRRTYSEADPANILYEIHMPSALLGFNGFLYAYVMHPRRDTEANRDAFKRCLEELMSSRSLSSFEQTA
ncbi:hypothetical protein V8D89_005205 [Ganoderma adspersum]